MAQETLKITITADNKQAVQNIQETVTATNQLGNAFRTMPNVADRSTNALMNLSRVAQDAPYGFMGIANNLNPLLESFQRLQKDAGGSGAALKAMASSLMGPAGIGLALGVASSLLVTFGDKLFVVSKEQREAEAAAKEHTEQLKEQKNAIDQIYASTAKEVTEVSSLIAVLQNENETRNRKLKALDALKKINPEIFSALQLEKGEVIGLNQAYDKYIANLSSMIALKIKQKELEQLTEEILKKQGVTITQEDKEIRAFGQVLRDSANTRKTDLELRQQGLKETIKQRKEEDALNGLLERRKKIFAQITELSQNVEVPNEYNKPEDIKEDDYGKQLVDEMQMAQYASKRFMDNMKAIGLEMVKLSGYTKSEENEIEKLNNESSKYYKKKLSDLSEQSNKTGFGATMQNLFKKDKDAIDAEEAEKKRLAELTKSYEKFAETIAGTVTNALFTMYDAIQQGENPLQAIGQMFSNIARQIAAAVVQALIFKALLDAFPALKGAFAALGTVNSALGIGKGMSALNSGVSSSSTFNSSGIASIGNQTNGQFVIKGNDLVLALQRSNSSLNLIRG